MQKLWLKRVLRELKVNLFRYLALFLLVGLGMYLIVSIVGAAETILVRQKEAGERNHVEDGEFTVREPLSDEVINDLSNQGITIEEMFSMDHSLSDGSVLRIFKNRKNINLLEPDSGRIAEDAGEIVLEKHYAESRRLVPGSTLRIADIEYHITGIGTVPDYEVVFQNRTDMSAESRLFGVGFITGEAYDYLSESLDQSVTPENHTYSFLLHDRMTSTELKEYLLQKSILTQFVKKADNARISAAVEDILINKNAGIIVGFVVMGLLAYVICVFVMEGIDRESTVIGALYALGIRQGQLIRHYLVLPVWITFAGGLAGTLAGFSVWGLGLQMQVTMNYFSLPSFQAVYPTWLILYGIAVPTVTAAAVNYLVIRGKLSRTALSLIRREEKRSFSTGHFRLEGIKFRNRFRIRQLLREGRSCLTVILGMFISLLVLMMGVNCYMLCRNMELHNREDTRYEYMYLYQFPEDSVPEGGEACYLKNLQKEAWGYDLEVTMIGVKAENAYFRFPVASGPDRITISDAVAWKYRVKEGDSLTLTDSITDRTDTFTVENIVPYSVGLCVFLDIGTMRELFGQQDDYYNMVLSKEKLNIPAERLYSTTAREDVIKKSKVFIEQLQPLIYTLTGVSILLFVTVVYLLMKAALGRQVFPIALMKIFGYRPGEVKSFFLSGPFVITAAAGTAVIPLSKLIMDSLYPYLISNVACGADLTFPWWMYALVYGGIILSYKGINKILALKIRTMLPEEVLKNRE